MREELSGRGRLRETELGPVVCEADYRIIFVSELRQGGPHKVNIRERAEGDIKPTRTDLSDGTYWLETAPGDDHQFIRVQKAQSNWTVVLTS